VEVQHPSCTSCRVTDSYPCLEGTEQLPVLGEHTRQRLQGAWSLTGLYPLLFEMGSFHLCFGERIGNSATTCVWLSLLTMFRIWCKSVKRKTMLLL